MNDPHYNAGAPPAPPVAPPPYGVPMQPPPPGRRPFPVLLGVAIGGGLVAMLLMAGVAVVLVKREMQHAKATEDPRAVPLTERYESANGLIAARYPADFAARRIAKGTIVLSRNGLSGDEALALISVAEPITDDPTELSRILEIEAQKALAEKGGTYTFGDAEPAKCVAGAASHPGVQRIRNYRSSVGTEYTGWSCTFVAGGHAYKFSYLVPQARAASERPLLKRIMEATELKP
jgi:hypothetical protein